MSLRRSSRNSTRVERDQMNDVSAKETVQFKKPAIKPRKSTARHSVPNGSTGNEEESSRATTNERLETPTTPKNKRRKIAPAESKPPITPTPSAVGFMTSSYSTGDIDDATPPPEHGKEARPAEPHMTNAPLRTPKGSQVVAKPAKGSTDSPAKPFGASGTTTENILDVACAHLIKQDPRLKTVIDRHHCHIFSPAGLAETIDPFRSLSSGIMAQQVSGAAAKSIKTKFIGLFNDGGEGHATFPTPAQVAATDVPRLRLAGLSQRKAEYIHGLAQMFAGGELTAKMLAEASDEEVLEKLTAVRGLGVWSVEMFACFGLKRMDILSTGDLGVQRGMAAYVGKDVAKLKAKGGGKWKYMSEKDMLDISAKFSPYRSLFMWLMWRIEDVNVEAVQGV